MNKTNNKKKNECKKPMHDLSEIITKKTSLDFCFKSLFRRTDKRENDRNLFYTKYFYFPSKSLDSCSSFKRSSDTYLASNSCFFRSNNARSI